MNPRILLPALATALFLSPFLASAKAQDAPPTPPVRGRVGPGFRAPSQPGRNAGDRPTRDRFVRDRLVNLGLSDAQKADMRKAMESARRDRLRKSTDLKIARMDLKSILQAEKVDEKAVAAKLLEAQTAQGALMKLRVDSALALKRILTPEQQKKMAELRGERGRQRMGRRMKMKDGRGVGPGQGRGGRNRFVPRPGGDGFDSDDDGDDDEDRADLR